MKEAYRFELIHGFKPQRQHGRLNGDGNEEQQIVARYVPETGTRQQKHRSKEQPRKKAGPHLLEAEYQELEGCIPHWRSFGRECGSAPASFGRNQALA
jgi:hypothetical protein